MPIFRNNAAGPRVFNLRSGLQQILQPGEVADVELAVQPDQDPVLKARIDSKEIEEVGQEALKSPVGNPEELAQAQQKLAEAQAEVERLLAARQAAELDQMRLTPPRQLGADGGPQQPPTVDGQGGALTPEQEEKGRPELPPAEAAKAMHARHSAGAPAPEAQKAEPAKPASRGR